MSTSVYLVSGNDYHQIIKKASQLSHKLIGQDSDPFNCDILTPTDQVGYEDVLAQCVESLQTPSFLGEKTVWLKNFPLDKEPKPSETGSFAKIFAKLIELINNLQGTKLIISGEGASKVKKLYKTVTKMGEAFLFEKIDMRDRKWEQKVRAKIQEIAQQKKLQLSYQVEDFLIQSIGEDTGRIDAELDKLLCYFNEGKIEDLVKVQTLCAGGKQTTFWSLANALSQRNLSLSLDVINRFLTNSKNDKSACIGLIQNIDGRFQQLIHCKILMQVLKTKTAGNVEYLLANLSEEQRSKELGSNLVIDFHPFRLRNLCEDCQRFSPKKILQISHLIVESNRLFISSQTSARVILENLTHHICL